MHCIELDPLSTRSDNATDTTSGYVHDNNLQVIAKLVQWRLAEMIAV